MRLTELGIQSFPLPQKGQKTYFDDVVRGFAVRCSSGGTRSFIVAYGPAQRRNTRTIGRHPAISLKEARTEAQRFLTTITPDTSKISVGEARSAFLTHCQTKNKPRTVKDYTRHLFRYLPEGRLTELTRSRLLSIFNSLSDTPGEQAHAYVTTTVFLNWCVAQGYLEHNPIVGIRTIGRINQRHRILTDNELQLILRAAHTEPYPFGSIVLLCILTGMRRSEVSNLQWSFIENGVITLPATYTKNHREHILPYGTLTASILAAIPRIDDRPYLFPGRGEAATWNGWGKAKARFDKTHTVIGYTLHDLRRTYASIHAKLSTPIHVIEKLLNHVSGPSFSGIAGVYNRYQYLNEMKAACQRYEDYLHSLCS